MHRHASRALKVLTVAVSLDALAGFAFAQVEHVAVVTGLYWAVTTATTVGYGDVTPDSWGGKLLAVIVMLTVIPLFAASFSLLTSGLTSSQVSDSEERLKRHFEDRLRSHLRKGTSADYTTDADRLESHSDTAEDSQ